MKEQLKELGTFLKALRQMEGLTLKQVSEMTGVPDQHLSQYETGSRTVSLEKLNSIFQTLGYEIVFSIKKIK